MAATLKTKLNLSLNLTHANTAIGLANVTGLVELSQLSNLESGVAIDQADQMFSENDKAISGDYNVDFTAVLLDIFGTAISFARIKCLMVVAALANTGTVIIGNHATAAWVGPFGATTETYAVPPGGAMVMFAPDATAWPVTATTADFLLFTPSTGTQTFDWAIVGASA